MSEIRKRRGFAAMPSGLQREISRKGGLSIPGAKRAFSQNRDLAREAGRKGGLANIGRVRARAQRDEAS